MGKVFTKAIIIIRGGKRFFTGYSYLIFHSHRTRPATAASTGTVAVDKEGCWVTRRRRGQWSIVLGSQTLMKKMCVGVACGACLMDTF